MQRPCGSSLTASVFKEQGEGQCAGTGAKEAELWRQESRELVLQILRVMRRTLPFTAVEVGDNREAV